MHNLYLRVLVENGWLAFLGWGLFLSGWLIASYHGSIRSGRFVVDYVVAVSVVAGILVESLVIDTLHWRHFFLFLAVPVGLLEHEKKTLLTSQPDANHAPALDSPGPQ